MRELTHQERNCWDTNGYVLLKNFLSKERSNEVRSWVDELASWPETPGRWMQYFEQPDPNAPKMLCRLENVIDYHAGLNSFLLCDETTQLVSKLMGEKAVLFKEKINYKLPGGGGFGAHHDAPAFTTFEQTFHITLMLSVDHSGPHNGGLDLVEGHPRRTLLPLSESGEIQSDIAQALTWRPIVTSPRDLLLFDSYIPHRSQRNTSGTPRRALYITYNGASEGNRRQDYFAHKRQHFPPECERIKGQDYSHAQALYNLGNPIR